MTMKPVGRIYVLIDSTNGKQYVGQTTKTLEQRLRRHLWPSTLEAGALHVANAIREHGAENFRIELVEECFSKDDMDVKELYHAQRLGTFYPAGYNLRAGTGPGATSEELKRRIGAGNVGKVVSDETRLRLSASHLGHRHSAETRIKLSIANSGKRGSDLCYEKAVLASSKTYRVVDPSGRPVVITNMRKFCRENGLNYPRMNEMLNGKRNGYKGWRLPSA